MNGFSHCSACEERRAHEEAERACAARGLTTLEAKKAYCRKLLRKAFAPPSFERWAIHITQGGVDFLVRSNGRDDQRVLERLEAMGVIDAQRKVVPVEERAARRAAHEAKVLAEQERLAEILKAQGVVRAEHEVQA
jgi:hypothetical protein